MRRFPRGTIVFAASLAAATLFASPGTAAAEDKIVHDAEYYVIEAQHGEEWAAEDTALQAKLDELKKKHGHPPQPHPHHVGRHRFW